MEWLDRLQKDLMQALKSREEVKVSTLRLLISAIRNKEIEKKKALTEGDVLDVIGSEAKRRRESASEFQKVGRAEMAAKEESELAVLQAYLPAAMSESELRALAEAAVQETGAKLPSDMGKVMSALMPKIKGRADGKQAQQLVQQLLKS